MSDRPRTVRSPRRTAALALVAGLSAALVLSACGSRVAPGEFGTTAGGTQGGGLVTGADGTTATGDLGAGDFSGDPGSDPGALGGGADVTGGGASGGGTSAGDTGGGPAGGGDSGGGDAGGASGGPAAPNVKAADCEGFKNGTGVTDSEIVIGNSSDISGPVPGLFEASQDALKAYVAYFNSTSDICGRKLKLVTYDSRTDAGTDQQTHTRACKEVFAMVGSSSAFDSGGAAVTEQCGLPDIRAGSLTNERNACKTCFGAQSTFTGESPNAVADWILKNYGDAGKKAGFLYINAGASAQNAPRQASAWSKRGMNFDVVRGIDISEFNYAPYVQQLKDEGVETVFWQGAWQQSIKLRQAMEQQEYEPTLYMRDPIDYHSDYVKSGGASVEDTIIYLNFTPFEEANKNQQTALYLSWLQRVRPGATPMFFGVFSWSAAQLFVEKATALGGNLSRPTLIDAFSKTDNWTNSGMHGPQRVGPKRTNECIRFVALQGGRWVSLKGTKYLCTGLTTG